MNEKRKPTAVERSLDVDFGKLLALHIVENMQYNTISDIDKSKVSEFLKQFDPGSSKDKNSMLNLHAIRLAMVYGAENIVDILFYSGILEINGEVDAIFLKMIEAAILKNGDNRK